MFNMMFFFVNPKESKIGSHFQSWMAINWDVGEFSSTFSCF